MTLTKHLWEHVDMYIITLELERVFFGMDLIWNNVMYIGCQYHFNYFRYRVA
jgi:hypothetical protein